MCDCNCNYNNFHMLVSHRIALHSLLIANLSYREFSFSRIIILRCFHYFIIFYLCNGATYKYLWSDGRWSGQLNWSYEQEYSML